MRVGADHVVVLPVDPALAGDRRRPEQGEERLAAVRRRRERPTIELLNLVQVRRPRGRPVIDRRLVDQRGVRNLGDDRRRDP